MKIVKLTAENVKRLRAVEITPDGNTVVIAGRNGQGKTSVLDSIWFALGGGPAARGTSKPIRDGEEQAQVTLDLGQIIVTRTWKGDRTTLTVENSDGATYKSPQALLDSLVGRLSFDPLAFAQQDERTQLASLIELVDLPFDPAELTGKRQTLYDQRTDVGRRGKQLEGQLAGMPKPADDLPAEPIPFADLMAESRAATEAYAAHGSAQRDLERLANERTRSSDRCDELERALGQERERLTALSAAYIEAGPKVEAMANDLPDLDALQTRQLAAESTNEAIRARDERARVAEQRDGAKAEYDALTDQIAALDQRKADAIAEAAMPIDGLAFDDNGVTYRDMPFKQCSSAEQLRVSLAMAMAMNPKIRVIRITDGSLLDSQNMQLIEEMAVANDFQCWIERVDETGSVGVLIEDGSVVAR